MLITFNPTILLLVMSPRGILSQVGADLYKWYPLQHRHNKRLETTSTSTNKDWLNKLGNIHIIEDHRAHKK